MADYLLPLRALTGCLTLTRDEQITIKALQAGDRKVFETFVNANKNMVFQVCHRFANSPEDAEDLAQEVFLEVFRSVGNFKGQSKLSTWVYRIAVSKGMDFVKSGKRQKRTGTVLRLASDGPDAAPEIQDAHKLTPDQEMEAADRRIILQNAIDQLPSNQAIAFRLSKIEGFSNKEVAEIMETSVSSVEALLNRARHKLRALLADFYTNQQQ